MALHWTISHPQRLVIALAKDELAFADIARYLEALAAEKALAYAKIFDISHVPAGLDERAVREAAALVRRYAGGLQLGPLAIVAVGDGSFEAARLFAAEAAAARPLTIFRELHLARQWLDAQQSPPEGTGSE
jgi:hypothetical protein